MASLHTIVGSILKDIIAAQHAANKYSLTLGAHYGSSGKLKNFQLPHALISGLSLNIPYAIKDISSKIPNKKINYVKLHRKYDDSAPAFAESIVFGFMETLKKSKEAGEDETFQAIYSDIASSKETKNRFCEFLVGKITTLFKEKTDSLLNKESGILHEDLILDCLEELAKSEISGHDELMELFKENTWEPFLEHALKAIRNKLARHTQKLCRSNFFIKEEDVVIDMLSTAEEMKDMPPESLHSLKLDISPRQFGCVKGPSDEDEFILNINPAQTS